MVIQNGETLKLNEKIRKSMLEFSLGWPQVDP